MQNLEKSMNYKMQTQNSEKKGQNGELKTVETDENSAA